MTHLLLAWWLLERPAWHMPTQCWTGPATRTDLFGRNSPFCKHLTRSSSLTSIQDDDDDADEAPMQHLLAEGTFNEHSADDA